MACFKFERNLVGTNPDTFCTSYPHMSDIRNPMCCRIYSLTWTAFSKSHTLVSPTWPAQCLILVWHWIKGSSRLWQSELAGRKVLGIAPFSSGCASRPVYKEIRAAQDCVNMADSMSTLPGLNLPWQLYNDCCLRSIRVLGQNNNIHAETHRTQV